MAGILICFTGVPPFLRKNQRQMRGAYKRIIVQKALFVNTPLFSGLKTAE
jgi:hypothetical protein